MQKNKCLIAILISVAEITISSPAFAEHSSIQTLFLGTRYPESSNVKKESNCYLQTSNNRVFDLSYMCSPAAAKTTNYSGRVAGGYRRPSRFGDWYCDEQDNKAGPDDCRDKHYPGFN